MAHAARTAEAIGGASAAPWEEMDAALGGSDIVITATGAAAPILTKASVEAVMRPRRDRPLFMIDIAMPRDVEPAAGEIEQVFLYNIDDLQATVSENMARRASEVERAEAIVGEEVDRFGAWLQARAAPFPTRRRPAAALRGHPAGRARAPGLQALGAAARRTRARRRNHAADRREAAADADRAAEGARRRRDGRRLQRGAHPALRARRSRSAGRASRPTARSQPFRRGRRPSVGGLGPRARASVTCLADLTARHARQPAGALAGNTVAAASPRPADPPAGSWSSDVGDRLQEAPLSEVGGKRLFVKEIEDALLAAKSISPSTAARTCRRCSRTA